jgi:hypothetical protein
MDLEKVGLRGDVAEAVKAVLRVVDPRIEDRVEEKEPSNPIVKGEWLGLWWRCMNGLNSGE